MEYEKTYLCLKAPKKLGKGKEIIDMYLPKGAKHAKLRIRKSGDNYTITKKELVNKNDASTQVEHNISITKDEFLALSKCKADVIRKTRYGFNGAEIDVFKDKLKGLVLVDVEYKSKKELSKAVMPEYCVADLTQEDCIAGGVLCKSNIKSVMKSLKKYL